MRRSLAALLATLVTAALLAGCGSAAQPSDHKTLPGPGTNPSENATTATQFFRAVASNDPAKVTAAFGLAAPGSLALSYLHLVREALLNKVGTAGTVTENNGRYKVCAAGGLPTCHTFSAITLVDGKVNTFTIDGKKLGLR